MAYYDPNDRFCQFMDYLGTLYDKPARSAYKKKPKKGGRGC